MSVYTPNMKQADILKVIKDNGGDCACGSMRNAARAITQMYDEVLRPCGLRATQLGILATTMAREPVTVSQLAETTVTDRTTLTRNLKLLVKKRLIHVREGDDRRERVVALTDRGREALLRAIPLWKTAQKRIVGGIGEEKWKSLNRGLGTVVRLARCNQ